MIVNNLIGHQRRHDVNDTVPLLLVIVLKLRVNVFKFQFSLYDRSFIKFWVEMNVNISNELNFSEVHRSINYNEPLAKFT